MKLALVGAGSRGMIYSRYAHDVLGDEIVAVADRHREKRERARQLFGTPEEMLFEDPLALIERNRDTDSAYRVAKDAGHADDYYYSRKKSMISDAFSQLKKTDILTLNKDNKTISKYEDEGIRFIICNSSFERVYVTKMEKKPIDAQTLIANDIVSNLRSFDYTYKTKETKALSVFIDYHNGLKKCVCV